LGRNITSLPQVQVVKFNAIANRFLKKTMHNIVKQEREIFKKIPIKEIDLFLDNIMKIGDVRSCISNLQLWAMNYVLALESKPDTDEDKLIDTSKFLVTNFQRENQMNLFHAIGKIIFSSSNFAQFSNQDYLSVEQVLTDFQESNFPLLNLSLLENYTMYKDGHYPLTVACQISNDLSLNDTMSSHMCKEIGIRSTRLNLRTVSSTEKYTHRQKTKFTRHFKMIKQYNKTFNQIRQYQMYVNNHRNSFQDLNLVDGYYRPLIYNRQNSTRYRYNRLGGRFQEIYADDELPVADDIQDDIKELDQFQVDINNKIRQIEQDQVDQELDDDDELSDPISEEETTDEDEFLDDSELDNLISRGQI
jgi:cell cycle checkpoint protein